MPLTPEELHQHSLELLYNSSHVIGIIPQSILYGVYTTLISMSSYMMLKKGLRTGTQRLLFWMTITMFVYSTLYLCISIGNLMLFIKGWFLDVEARGSPGDAIQLFSAIGLINYVLTDGVVVWRAWVLCRDDSPRLLGACLFFLSLASTSVLTTIGVRIALFAVTSGEGHKKLSRAIDVTQVANLVLSLLTNILAVSIVSIKAWQHRRFFTEMRVRDSKTHSARILALLIESGIFYCISLITVLVATVIRLPVGTFGDLYTPVNVQIAGIYPIIVLLLVNHERSLDRTVFVGSAAVHVSGFSTTASRSVAVSSVFFRSNPTRSEGDTSETARTTTAAEPSSPTTNTYADEESIRHIRHTRKKKSKVEAKYDLKWDHSDRNLPDVPSGSFAIPVDEIVEEKRQSLV
ncbi:hypothetical protein EIP91_009502 [Steccherinum ochraceum]|uniref:Uncharacterized protein n=1 Tax=Steccherinum ochraceum TaxID=92696 RepID=A0A4R0R1K8_9APHY|nr:hypothetical protein EIP91_009502 [Steccherinum ochraceum]